MFAETLRVYLGLVADGCVMVVEVMRFRPHERPVKVSERFGELDAFRTISVR
jgi:hypothetical protein